MDELETLFGSFTGRKRSRTLANTRECAGFCCVVQDLILRVGRFPCGACLRLVVNVSLGELLLLSETESAD